MNIIPNTATACTAEQLATLVTALGWTVAEDEPAAPAEPEPGPVWSVTTNGGDEVATFEELHQDGSGEVVNTIVVIVNRDRWGAPLIAIDTSELTDTFIRVNVNDGHLYPAETVVEYANGFENATEDTLTDDDRLISVHD